MENGVTSLTDGELEKISGGAEMVTTKDTKYKVGDHVEVKCKYIGIFNGTKGATVTEVVFVKYNLNDEGQMLYHVLYRVKYDDGSTELVDLDEIE